MSGTGFKRNLLLLALPLFLAAAGCGQPDVTFRSNRVYAHKLERANFDSEKPANSKLSAQHLQDLANVLEALFGTPDDPRFPALGEVDSAKVMSVERLQLSAGRVLSFKSHTKNQLLALPGEAEIYKGPQGLFREHCVHCHGVTGDGAGPTAAFLNPYPRDYRKGVFKFKSSEKKSQAPTHADLKRVLVDGIPGTAMPSFKVLADDEIESLVEYVKYLAIRGEIERGLIDTIGELENDTLSDAKDRLIDISLKSQDPEKVRGKMEVIREIAGRVVQKWIDAESQVTQISARSPGWDAPEQMAKSIAHGRELFYGPIANCVKCHGDSALGDGQTSDFDDWTKELELDKPQAVAEYRALNALEPRNIRPRNLRMGIYRGGRRPIDIFWRIHNGIDGTPMPAALVKPADAPADQKGLTIADIWSLVDYVRSLPYESINNPETNDPNLPRDRM